MKDWYVIGTGALLGILCGSTFFIFPLNASQDPAGKAVEEMSVGELFHKGQYYFNQDEDPDGAYDLVKAREYYKEIVYTDPRAHKLAWYQLGRIDFLEGKFDSAIYKFNKQVEYFENEVPNVHYMLGLTYGYRARTNNSENDWRKAEAGFLNFLAHEPESPWARVDLSWVYFSQGKYAEMKKLLEERLEENSENAWYLNMYGLALLNIGSKERAHEFFLKAETIAQELTVAEWGRAYPGNNPQSWPLGLAEMKKAIAHNVLITEEN